MGCRIPPGLKTSRTRRRSRRRPSPWRPKTLAADVAGSGLPDRARAVTLRRHKPQQKRCGDQSDDTEKHW